MSKLTDIKNRIDQMDGGAFQNLCDAYLYYKGYKNGYSLGMNTGTDKTAKGNPDTYFLTDENKYVFVMYTTQKTDFLKKAIEDIDKCFDLEKIGVSAKDIAEIIYCHTYGRLGAGDDQYLRRHCEGRGTVLTLIGLDKLANDIFRECPILAKDFFGINIESGQILPLDMFVEKHDANQMSAPLATEFLFRETELEKAKVALQNNDVLLIAGPAGVGKTRFALELCRQLTKENGYTALVIKNNNLQLHEDLVSAIEPGKNYLVFVDDANELSGLRYVLDYLPRGAAGSRHISKLILTVRDYARKQVMQSVMDVVKPETIKISTFHDDDIRKLMETCYKDISDDILQILGSFKDHSELPTALDLLLLYYKKRPDLFEQFYSIYTRWFEVSLDTLRLGYFTQSAVVKNLCEAVEAEPENTNLLSLFVRVARHFLKLDVSKAESGRHNTVSFYTIMLPPDQPVIAYRKMLLLQLYQIYQRGNMHAEIEFILYGYGVPNYGVDTNHEVIKTEFEEILSFFSLFQPQKLTHCIIAGHIKHIAEYINYRTLA